MLLLLFSWKCVTDAAVATASAHYQDFHPESACVMYDEVHI